MPRIPARLAQHPCRHVLEQPAASIALNPTEVLQPRHVGYTETFAFSCLTFPAPGRLDLERHACPLPLRIRLEHDTSIAAVPSPPSTFFPGLVLLLELLPGALHWSFSKRPYEVRCKHTPSVPTRGCNSGGGGLVEKIRGSFFRRYVTLFRHRGMPSACREFLSGNAGTDGVAIPNEVVKVRNKLRRSSTDVFSKDATSSASCASNSTLTSSSTTGSVLGRRKDNIPSGKCAPILLCTMRRIPALHPCMRSACCLLCGLSPIGERLRLREVFGC